MVEVPKSQHKYVIGARGTTIQEILKETGVSVEMPPPDSTTGTITLHGPHNKIGLGLYSILLIFILNFLVIVGTYIIILLMAQLFKFYKDIMWCVLLQLCQRCAKKQTL